MRYYKPKLTTYIYDRNDELLYKTFEDENRTLVKLNDLSPDLINAIIAIEDEDFYEHAGISLPSMARAAYANYKEGDIVQGGSTITQQLVKNTLLTHEQTIERKLKEAILSILIETKFNKDEILEMYLNTVSFGGTSYGIQEASLMYFNKDAKDLSLSEVSLLAGLPASPSRYTPYVSLEKAKARQQVVLARMLKSNYISVKAANEAYDSELNIYYPEAVKNYPHFVNYITAYLEQKYGNTALTSGGLKVYTSLDPEIQDMAQNIVANEISTLQGLRISNGAALVTKNKTGEVVAMVGSKDFKAQDIDGYVNVTTALRQPGSSIKPFNYSLALNNGMTAATIIKDEPVTYSVAGSPPYSPKNYDNKFRGNVTIRRSLANSLNIPAVKVLELNGVDNFIEYVKKFGINTWDRDYYGLSLALGAAEVRMIDMNGAYSVFANNGDLVKINPILYIELPNGNLLEYNPCIYSKDFFEDKSVIYDNGPCREKVISSGNAFVIKSILTDFKARSEAFGTNSVLNVTGTGSKTGTTNDLKDNWTFGFNEDYTVGAWVGNNDNTPMSYVASGVTGASPIWAKIISNITNEQNYVNLNDIPSDVVKVDVCPITGDLACGSCGGASEYFIKGTAPTKQCSDRYIRQYLKQKNENEEDKDDD
jgi:1A family penicillin-binding protein